jgi:hypothetical protein
MVHRTHSKATNAIRSENVKSAKNNFKCSQYKSKGQGIPCRLFMELKVKEKGLLADLFRYVKSLCDNHSAKGQCCSDKDNERASVTML